jgi:hypothetical protein
MSQETSTTGAVKVRMFSWKNWAIAFVAGVLIQGFLSAATGSRPHNAFWTICWIWLTIEAWKFWHWKALLPYVAVNRRRKLTPNRGPILTHPCSKYFSLKPLTPNRRRGVKEKYFPPSALAGVIVQRRFRSQKGQFSMPINS